MFGVEVGMSDYTLGIVALVMVVTLDARIIEKHFILDKSIGKVNYKLTDKVKVMRKFSPSSFLLKGIKVGEVFTK